MKNKIGYYLENNQWWYSWFSRGSIIRTKAIIRVCFRDECSKEFPIRPQCKTIYCSKHCGIVENWKNIETREKFSKSQGKAQKKRYEKILERQNTSNKVKVAMARPEVKEKVSKGLSIASKKIWQNTEYRDKMSKIRQATAKDSDYKKKMSKSTKEMHKRPEVKKKHSLSLGGTGVPYEYFNLANTIRHLPESISWRKFVFERDKYICQDCRDFSCKGHPVYLEAHHKIPFAKILKDFLLEYNQFSPIEDKETLVRLAVTYKPFWNIENGKTLCKSCHNKYINKHELLFN